jgi:hypothetical protein
MRYVLTWLGLAVLIGAIAASFDWSGYRQLAKHGVRTEGKVTAVLPDDHATARYTYSAGGHVFTGQRHPWSPNPTLEHLRVGQVVTVYYDPASPGFSVLGDPGPIYWNETASVFLGPFWLSTPTVLLWRRWSRRRRSGEA